MVFAILMYLGFVLLALKTIWNLALPYRLALRPYNNVTGATGPVSLEVGFDLFFLVWTLLFIPFSDEDYLFCSKLWMAVFCLAFPIGAYVHLVVMGFFCGWVKATFSQKKPME